MMPPRVRVDRTIKLTQIEQKLFAVLRDVIRTRNLTTVVRAAGGWVRDKLLGHESDDIDLAVDKGTGMEFAEHIKAYLDSKGQSASHSTMKEIKANPDQSKLLATTTFTLFGIDIDINNLRTETYAQGS